MKLVIVKNEEQMGVLAADIVLSTMMQPGRINLSLTAGRSPKELYKNLIPRMEHLNNLNNIFYYTFDETPILNDDNEVVGTDNWSKVNNVFYRPAKVSSNNQINLSDENYMNYDNLIDNAGGLDLMVIGLGEDGHFCANMPECTELDSETYRVELNNEFPWNAPYQDSLGGNHSKYMYSLGPKSVMRVKRVVLIVNGINKAIPLKKMLEEEVNKHFPASVLKLHPNITVICDEDATSQLNKETIEKYI